MTEHFRGDILAVDDTPNNLRLLSSILTVIGYKVRSVTDGELALKAALSAPPDLILLDIDMPKLNGYQVCEQLKADDRTSAIPVIFISALDQVVDKVKAFEVGGADYITKPFQTEEVLARVESHLALQRLKQLLQEQNAKLQKEVRDRLEAEQHLQQLQEKSETLLHNMLPEAIAKQLKQSNHLIADRFEAVTILFADIVNFSPIASQLPPTDLVYLLNQIFSEFDQLAEQFGVEKIKTIGDEYMVAAGVPAQQADHAQIIAQLALAMQIAIARFERIDGTPFSLRIGINSGAVVAGVIGIHKFTYDLWGDTVNIASRMQVLGEAGKIQITEATYNFLKADYHCQLRGEILVKGKGAMKTYWLLGKK